MILGRTTLDKMTCMEPNCTNPHDEPLTLTSVCHPFSGTRIDYKDGVLNIRCHECGADIVEEIEVAP